MNINDIFTIEQYDEAYVFVQSNEYATIKDLGNGQYQIVQLHIPTEEEKAQAEKERIAHLHLTAADVERALYKARNMDFEDLVSIVQERKPDIVKLLKIELKAKDFYRGNKYIGEIGSMLNITSENLDKFFESNDYKYLLPRTLEKGQNE